MSGKIEFAKFLLKRISGKASEIANEVGGYDDVGVVSNAIDDIVEYTEQLGKLLEGATF